MTPSYQFQVSLEQACTLVQQSVVQLPQTVTSTSLQLVFVLPENSIGSVPELATELFVLHLSLDTASPKRQT